MSLRARLKRDLEALLPGYRITRGITVSDRIAKRTIILEQSSIDPSQGARGLLEFTVKVHVVTEREGVTDAAEDTIDQLVLEVLAALEKVRYLNVGVATKKVYNDTNLSYEIETTNLARKGDIMTPAPTVVDVEPIYLDNATLIIDTFDYAAAASKIECQPTIKTATFRGMKPSSTHTSTSVESWVLSIDFAQDFATAESFSNTLFDNQGDKVTIEFAPADGGQAWLVDVQLVPGGIGGSGQSHATTSISLGVLGQPRRKTPVIP